MPEPERVIAALPCLASVLHDCLNCSYNPHPGMPWPYGCHKGQGDIVQEAITLLQRQIPIPVKRWNTKERSPYCPNPDCGYPLEEGQAFCAYCGQAVKWITKCDDRCPYFDKYSGLCGKDDHFNPHHECDMEAVAE